MANTAEHPTVPGYQRHRPERTLLYRVVETHYPGFADLPASQGRTLPRYVQREFEDYLKSGRPGSTPVCGE